MIAGHDAYASALASIASIAERLSQKSANRERRPLVRDYQIIKGHTVESLDVFQNHVAAQVSNLWPELQKFI